ncbi:unnamed protein product [Arctia plantaginis]|uniref:BED-type domain-containing protein n=1 Tax=Arctia plantaginis TaxID=874455 RepID=A0A8S0YZ48_ARCPL|nr:unnamed protein product [Arctia plantaginis]
MAPPKKSHVWKFFTKIEGNENLVKCKICQKTIKSCGNTSNLLSRVKNIHKAAFLDMNKEYSQVLSNVNLLNIHSETITKTNEADSEPAVPSPEPLPSISTAVSKYIHVDNPVPPPLKRQKSIDESFKNISAYSESGNKTLQVNNALIYMICKDNQPFTIVENDGFRNIMKITAPHYKLPSHFGICTEFFSITLGVYQSFDRNTSNHIAEMLLNSCSEWDIDVDKVSAVVTDNAASMIKAVDLAFGKKHIPCFAHTLNLVALNAIQHCPELQNLITKLKTIVTWFKQSNTASNELRKATEKETKLIQEVSTRWNSTYYMIERFLELRIVINDIIFRHRTAPPMLNASELSVLSSVLLVLRPLEAATKEISGDRNCTSSKVIPLVHCLVLKIQPLQLEDSLANELKSFVLNEIEKRMGAIERVTPLAIATVLDPRYKKIHFRDALACSTAVAKIKDLMKNTTQNVEMSESDSDQSEKQEESFSLWDHHHKLVSKSWKSSQSDDAISDELSIYLRSPVSGRLNENPLEIWQDLKIQFPKLYKIAFKYLTIVGTSVPSERLFSKAAQIVNQQRNRMKAIETQKTDVKVSHEATTLAEQLKDFSFIVSLVVWYDILFQINIVSKSLQLTDTDLGKRTELLGKCCTFLEEYRNTGFKSAILTAKELAEELEIEPVFKATTRIRYVKRQAGETARDEPIASPEKIIEIELFNCLLDTTLISVNERFEQLNEYSEYWSFLYNIKQIPVKPDLVKFCGDLQLKLTIDTKSDIDGCMLCDELISLKSLLPDLVLF